MTLSRLLLGGASVFAASLVGLAHAQVAPGAAPDAGQVLRELQPPAAALPHAAVPGAVTAPAVKRSEAGPKVLVRGFRIVGATVIPTGELLAKVTELVGQSLSLGELDAAAGRITADYRAHGYSVARAYLPQQDITDGMVVINVLEGRIGQTRLKNSSRLSDRRALDYLTGIQSGQVIRSSQMDRGLLLLSDTPGAANARAALQPGASVGTSDLVVEVSSDRLLTGRVTADNYGSRYTGEARVAAGLALNSPLKIGDQLTLDAISSGGGLVFGRVSYQAPIGADGLRLGVAYFDTRYELGEEFKALDAHGTARSASVFAVYPFLRSQGANLNGAFTLEQKDLKDIVGSTSTITDKRARLATFGFLGNRQDRFAGGGVTSLDLSGVYGELQIQSPMAKAIDAASAHTSGAYARLAINANRLQRVTSKDFLLVTGSGQLASKNLDSSEKFTLAGVNGVRAYPQGEGIGDEGALVSVEWRHDLVRGLQAAAFYDAGTVEISKNPFTVGIANQRHLSGAGVGAYGTLGPLQLKAMAAWRISGGTPTSIPHSAVHQPTVWLQAGVSF
jgi:hemolysin activation/secretion protein